MLKRLVTIQEFVKVSSVLNPDNINLELDIDSALNNFNNLSTIDKQTIKLQQYLDQAGKQIDSFSNGQIYNMWDYINSIIEEGPNEHVNSIQIADYKNNIDTIKYVIIKWVEVFIYTHQIFVDANVEAPSNLQFNIEGKSDNANIESTRLDLINILNTTFFFEKVYVTGSVEDDRFNPLTDLGQFSGLEIGPLDTLNYKFSNGYIVKDVPYLGLENKGRLDLLEPRVNTLEQNQQGLIDRVNGIQDNLNTTNRQVEQNKQDIANIIGGSSGITLKTLDQRVTQNKNNITQNRSDLGGFYNQYTQFVTNIRAELQDVKNDVANISNDIKFRGIWNAATTYNLGDQVSYEDEFYVSLINNNLNIVPKNNPTQWKQPDKAIQSAIDTSINKLREQLQPQIDANQRNITSNTERLNDYFVDLNALTDRVTINETHIRDLQSLTNTHTQQISQLTSNKADKSELTNFLRVSNQAGIGKQVDERLNINGLLSMRNGSDIEFQDSSGYKSLHKSGDNIQWGGQNLSTENYVNEKIAAIPPTDLSQVAKLNVDNTYAQGKRNIFRTLPEVYTQSTTPTKPVELTTKKYVDDAIANAVSGNLNVLRTDITTSQNVTGLVNFNGGANISGYRALNTNDLNQLKSGANTWTGTNTFKANNEFTGINTFKSSVQITSPTGLYIQDQSGNNSLRIFSEQTRSGKTNFAAYGTSGIYDLYYLRQGGPKEDNDITNKKYVDSQVNSVRKNFKVKAISLSKFNITWNDTNRLTSHCYMYVSTINNFGSRVLDYLPGTAKIISIICDGRGTADNRGCYFSLGNLLPRSSLLPSFDGGIPPFNLNESVSLNITNHTPNTVGDDYNTILPNSYVIIIYVE